MSLLEVRALTVRFGGSTAVDGIALAAERGQLVGLIGPNGAGKTTTVDAITGFVACSGTVTFNGRQFDGGSGWRGRPVSPTRRARAGLARTWQGADLFNDLSVRDNLRVAGEKLPPTEVDRVLGLLGIGEQAGESVTALSHGQRKLVGVGRALAASPMMICMDEPAAGLDTAESLQLGHRIRSIADDGTAVLLIDHDMGLVLTICDVIYVLDFGLVIASGTPGEIRSNDRVIEAYLGQRSKGQEKEEPTEVGS
jgi:branched-chain amino acid transport system ATP-binding protein